MVWPIYIRSRVAIIAIFFIAFSIVASVFYWIKVVEPTLQGDMRALASSMASSRANELAILLSEKGTTEKDIEHALDTMLAYTYEKTKESFFKSIKLELSDSYKKERIYRQRFHLGGDRCKQCFYRDYPLYSDVNYELIGVVELAISNTYSESYISSVQRLFLTGVMAFLFSLVVVLFVLWNMTSMLDSLNNKLEKKVIDKTESLNKEMKEHKETQKKLGEIRDEIQGMERGRMARNLHDGVGQILQAMKLGLQSLGEQLEDSPKQTVDELVVETSQAINMIRQLSSELRPLHLHKMTLGQAIHNHVDRLNKRIKNCQIITKEDGEPSEDLSELMKEQLFLITVELLNNSIKHSHAKLIIVKVKSHDDCASVSVEDDGIGFSEIELVKFKEGIGLTLIKERCERIGAEFSLHSQPDKGCFAETSVLIRKS